MKKISTPKTILLIFVQVAFFSFKSNATIFKVNVEDFQFSPANIPNVMVGDTVEWDWVLGSFSHTTTCDPVAQGIGNSLPAGAATWDSPMNATTSVFQYKVTVAGTYNYWCIPHHAFGMVASFTASAPLPVKLSAFKVANDNNKAVLNWTTQSEENIAYFSIQKSKTGADFSEIARVPATGNSSTLRSYNYIDANSSSADKYYYYMLAIIDKDGKKEFSPVELFRNKLNAPTLITFMSPNPVSSSGHLMLKFNAEKAGKMDVKIANAEGKYILQTSMEATEGVNNGHLMLGNISAGTYSVIFTLNNIKEVHNLVVE